jgi:hypothetical protein
MSQIKEYQVKLSLPFGLGSISGTWKPDEAERKAAWEMYVELITRVSVVELKPDEGLLREALSSLYTLFGTTRQILRTHGPDVAKVKNDKALSFGYLAVNILNYALRPLLAKWHPLLLDYEAHRPKGRSPLEHERTWDRYEELRAELKKVQDTLFEYANILAQVAGVPLLAEKQIESS